MEMVFLYILIYKLLFIKCVYIEHFYWFDLNPFKIEILQKMFSTPQARAYLSQELTKNRLVSSEIDMMVECRSDLLTIKQTIASIFKILTQNE